jgi:hypothetical protein
VDLGLLENLETLEYLETLGILEDPERLVYLVGLSDLAHPGLPEVLVDQQVLGRLGILVDL